MKKILKLTLIMITTIILTTLGANILVLADAGLNATTQGDVQFTLDYSDPEVIIPGEPGIPGEPETGTPPPEIYGPLRIDFVSNFDFGIQDLNDSTGGLFYANTQRWVGDTPNSPLFTQVTDLRGTQEGWRLTLLQPEQFRNLDGFLRGAQLRFQNVSVTNTSGQLPTQSMPAILEPGVLTEVANAASLHGMGTTHVLFGTIENALGDTTPDVQLSVPEYALPAGTEDLIFQTTLLWVLENTPQD